MQTKPIYFCSVFILFFVLVSTQAQAQNSVLRQTISSSSSIISSASNQNLLHQCIGQMSPIGTFQSDHNAVRQGFLQPHFKVQFVGKQEEFILSVFPNPFQDEFRIEIEEPIAGSIQLQLIDLSGRIVKNETLSAASITRINWSEIENGTYILRIQNDQKFANIQIQKL